MAVWIAARVAASAGGPGTVVVGSSTPAAEVEVAATVVGATSVVALPSSPLEQPEAAINPPATASDTNTARGLLLIRPLPRARDLPVATNGQRTPRPSWRPFHE